MSGPRVQDSAGSLFAVGDAPITGSQTPVPPAADKDGTVFISLATFRDGKRCADTIKSIFDNASEPDKVVIGLIEENAMDDDFCLDVYCKNAAGVKSIEKKQIRADMIKIMTAEGREKCPRIDQVRQVSVFNVAAKGPNDARSLGRKVLGNEEYCMQIDSHTAFTKDWDKIAKLQWKMVQNEFAVLSTVPAAKAEQSEYESWTGSKSREVPRSCHVKFGENGLPDFPSPADAKAMDLEKPLLAHAWSAAFSFAKCHLEETTPYDPFIPYLMGAEQFARYARLWTRGYDVYTPTRNIVYHDYIPNPDGHGMQEWMRQRRKRIRDESMDRVMAILEQKDDAAIQHNSGIYGLGKRRSLAQLEKYVGIDLARKTGNGADCGSKQWVPYDTSISPIENMFSKPTDLDPQPEFPLRTETVFYHETEQPPGIPELEIPDGAVAPKQQQLQEKSSSLRTGEVVAPPSSGPPTVLLFVLWVFGLIVWCMVFVNTNSGGSKKPRRRRKGGTSSKDM
uniref:Uncharacterized protein n=1 Tax=Grammatophora oceanica TaxID=210454 RepID=A0A7S1VEF1_9STRA